MRKRLSGLLLAVEIVAIVMLHALKISHQGKNERLTGTDASLQQPNISLIHSYSLSRLK